MGERELFLVRKLNLRRKHRIGVMRKAGETYVKIHAGNQYQAFNLKHFELEFSLIHYPRWHLYIHNSNLRILITSCKKVDCNFLPAQEKVRQELDLAECRSKFIHFVSELNLETIRHLFTPNQKTN